MEKVLQTPRNLPPIAWTEKETARTPVNVAVFLAGAANRRRVNNRREPLDVLHDDAVKERFVSVKERDQPDILFQWVVFGKEMLEFHRDLLFDVQHGWRQEAFDAEPLAFGNAESGVAVLRRIAQNFFALRPTGSGRSFHNPIIWERWRAAKRSAVPAHLHSPNCKAPPLRFHWHSLGISCRGQRRGMPIAATYCVLPNFFSNSR
jgi:hypothetical protein